MPLRLSTYFTWYEVVGSETADRQGIDNSLPVQLTANAEFAAKQMDKVRKLLNKPIIVSSWYRCPALNTYLRGSRRSQHMLALAIDFTSPSFGSPFKVAKALEPHLAELGIDQLIYEHTWCHVSFAPNPRNEALTLNRGDRTYLAGIVE